MLKSLALLILTGLAIVTVAGLGFAIVAAAWPYLLGLAALVIIGFFVWCLSSDGK